MQYVTLASTEYRKGRILFFPSRFSRRINNASVVDLLIRRSLEWLSYSKTDDTIRVCSVVHNVVDGNVMPLYGLDRVELYIGDIPSLSNSSFLSFFDVLVLNGADNYLSPLVRTNIINFVGSGGGLILCDFNLTGENLELMDSVAPLYVESSGVNIASGFNLWLEAGQAHFIYDKTLSSLPVVVLNSVKGDDISSNWTVLSVFDTEYTPDYEEDYDEDEEEISVPSADFDIDGAYFTVYFRAVYEDGIMQASSSSSSG